MAAAALPPKGVEDERRDSIGSATSKRRSATGKLRRSLSNSMTNTRSAMAGLPSMTSQDGEARDAWETISSRSVASASSRSSLGSWASISTASRSMLSKMMPPRASGSKGKLDAMYTEEILPGDRISTVNTVLLRETEDLHSPEVVQLPLDALLLVIEIRGRRLKVRYDQPQGPVEGWISIKTRLDEWLVQKQLPLAAGFADPQVGQKYQAKRTTQVHSEPDETSEVKAKLKAGALFTVEQLHNVDRYMVRITAPMVTGWVRVVNAHGRPRVGPPSEKAKESSDAVIFMPKYVKIRTLLEAAVNGDLEGVSRVLENRATGLFQHVSGRPPDINSCDIRGKTSLMYAAALGHKKLVWYLLSRPEVDVNAMDDTLKTALHHASKRGRQRREGENWQDQSDIVGALIDHQANIEARDYNGCTAMMFGSANGDMAVARALVLGRADLSAMDWEGHTALDYAINFQHQEIAAMLREHGAIGELDVVAEGSEHDEVETNNEAVDEVSPPASPTAATDDPGAGAGGEEGDEEGGVKRKTSSPGKAKAKAKTSPKTSEKPKLKKGSTVTFRENQGSSPEHKGSAAPKSGGKKKSIAGTSAAGASPASPSGRKSTVRKSTVVAKAAAKKKSKRATSAALSAGMLEAVSASSADASAALTVNVVEAEEGEAPDARQLASKKLAALLASAPAVGELEVALKAAEAAGCDEAELSKAHVSLTELRASERAQARLRRAADDRDVVALREAIAEAEAAKVPSKLIANAKAVLQVEEPRELARASLFEARVAGDVKRLKEAIAEAQRVGVEAAELAEFQELLLGAESKENAEAILRTAIEERSVPDLRIAIQQARDSAVDASLIESAEAVLKEEEPMQRAREQLAVACEQPSIEALKEAIKVAEGAKYEGELVVEARRLLEVEEEKFEKASFVRSELQAVAGIDADSGIEEIRAAKERLSAAIKGAVASGVPLTELAEAESRRKKLHNTIEDLKGSIRVFCRVRPLSGKEKDSGDSEVVKATTNMSLEVEEGSSRSAFHFDAVFTPGSQAEVFEDCRDLVQSAVDGYNVTMFAYGQTGAGKTFTMYGTPKMEGVAPQTIREVFSVIEAGKSRCNYTVMGSMLELYRNDLVDLLSKGSPDASKSKLNVKTDKSGSVMVDNLTSEVVKDSKELLKLLDRGSEQRSVAATAMNSESSRSHLVLIITIISVNRETKERLKGKILICDLAGSERLKKSQVSDEMQKEAIEINKSLTALGDVIEALTQAQKVVPYRNHKLTQLMQDALGGTAKTLMFVNCSPANSNTQETLMSLKYATRAKRITNTSKKAG